MLSSRGLAISLVLVGLAASLWSLRGHAQVGRLGTLIPTQGSACTPGIPDDPFGPSPANNATGVALSGTLTWLGCARATTFTVVGPDTNNPPTGPVTVVSTPSQTYSNLSATTTYFWKVSCSNNCGTDIQPQTFQFTTTSVSPAAVLQVANLTPVGMFTGPAYAVPCYAAGNSVAMRYETGRRHYFQVDHLSSNCGTAGADHDIIQEFTEPVSGNWSTVGTPFASSFNVSTNDVNWGQFTVNAANGFSPFYVNNYVFDLNYDSTLNYLTESWINNYSTQFVHNTFAAATLGTPSGGTGTLTTVGCWEIPNVIQSWVGSGIMFIPSSFVSANLPTGARWWVGVGIGTGNSTQFSLGLTGYATPVPSPNACPTNTDTPVTGSVTLIAQHGANWTGPNCYPGTGANVPASGLGCTPTTAPTSPYPAQRAFANYSTAMSGSSWDPWSGHGWMGWGDIYKSAWYDDPGVKTGILVPYDTSSGWLNTTVVSTGATQQGAGCANTQPTNLCVTFTLTSSGMHDGFNLNPGDYFAMQSCTAGVDAGCFAANSGEYSTMIVNAINTSTNVITAGFVAFSSCTACDDRPIVPGHVYAGNAYVRAQTMTPRRHYRLQIYDPTQFAKILSGANPDNSTASYNEETTMVTHFGLNGLGDPSLGTGGIGGCCGNGTDGTELAAVIPDPVAHQIIFVYHAAFGGSHHNVFYVFNVSSTP